jgi:hypothetical protein
MFMGTDDTVAFNRSWKTPQPGSIPFEQLRAGERYHVVIDDC